MKTTDFLGNEWDIDCMGCAVGGEAMPVPGGFIQRTEYFCVHQDPFISLPGFLVIASLRHIQSISEMQTPEFEEHSSLIRKAHHAIKAVTGIEFLTLIQEEYSIHFHSWFFPWTKGVIEQYGRPSLAKIREIMSDYRKQPISPVAWKKLETTIENIRQCWHKF
jgi:diadenosine tetraphosphate (Ap4A) HIT family hydrolase